MKHLTDKQWKEARSKLIDSFLYEGWMVRSPRHVKTKANWKE